MVSIASIDRGKLVDIDRILWRHSSTAQLSQSLQDVGRAIATWLEDTISDDDFRPIVVGTGIDFEETVVPITDECSVNVGCFWPFAARDRAGRSPLIYLQQEYWEPPIDGDYTHALIVQPMLDNSELVHTLVRRVRELSPRAKICLLTAALENRLAEELNRSFDEESLWSAQVYDAADDVNDYWTLVDRFNRHAGKIMPRMSPWLLDRLTSRPVPRLGNPLGL